MTSLESEERKASVVAGLGHSLARAGHATLLISADLRSPRLDEYFAGDGELSMAKLLEIGSARDDGLLADEIRAATTMHGAETTNGAARLDVIPAGRSAPNPSRPLSDRALATIFNELKSMPYRYVVVDAPPLLGTSDAYVLLRWATSTVIVADPYRLHPEVVATRPRGARSVECPSARPGYDRRRRYGGSLCSAVDSRARPPGLRFGEGGPIAVEFRRSLDIRPSRR